MANFELQRLILAATHAASAPVCQTDGHDWIDEGGRSCPMGAEGCSQAVYVCRSCGQYDYGEGDDSPGKIDCQAVCGDSMMGWRGGPLDPGRED